jgi:hypothetical protein
MIEVDNKKYMGYGLTMHGGTVVIVKESEHSAYQLFYKGKLTWSLISSVLLQLNSMTLRRNSMRFKFDLGPEYKRGFRMQADRLNKYDINGLYFDQTETEHIVINGETIVTRGNIEFNKTHTLFTGEGKVHLYHHEMWWDERQTLINQVGSFSFNKIDISIDYKRVKLNFDILGLNDMSILDTVLNLEKCDITMNSPEDQDFATIDQVLSGKFAMFTPRDKLWSNIVKSSNMSKNKDLVMNAMAQNYPGLSEEKQTKIWNILNSTDVDTEQTKIHSPLENLFSKMRKTSISKGEQETELKNSEIVNPFENAEDPNNNNNNQTSAVDDLIEDMFNSLPETEGLTQAEIEAIERSYNVEDIYYDSD